MKLPREKLKRMYEGGHSTVEIAAAFGISTPATVATTLRRMGVSMRGRGCRNGLSPEQRAEKILKLYHKDFTVQEMVTKLKVSTRQISEVLKEASVPRKVKRQLLAPEQRTEVVRRYREYATYEELTKEYDCSPSVIKSALTEHGFKPRVGWSKYRTVDWTDRKGRQLRFKSSWEKAFAERLDSEGADWSYEPRSYTLKVCRQYTPDFEVLVGGALTRLVEIKGWMDQRTENRLTEFCQTYSDLPFELLGPAELANMGVVGAYWMEHPQAGVVTRAAVRLTEAQIQKKTSS
jgi:hypothetical protein